jgi:hypothetical protein
MTADESRRLEADLAAFAAHRFDRWLDHPDPDVARHARFLHHYQAAFLEAEAPVLRAGGTAAEQQAALIRTWSLLADRLPPEDRLPSVG